MLWSLYDFETRGLATRGPATRGSFHIHVSSHYSTQFFIRLAPGAQCIYTCVVVKSLKMDTLKSWQARSQKYLTPESSYSPVTVLSSFSDEPEKEHESDESSTQRNESQASIEHVEGEVPQKPRDKRYVLYKTLSIALGVLFVVSLIFNARSSTNVLSRSPSAAEDVTVSKDAALFPGTHKTFAFNNGTQWVRPAELKVIGIIFCAFSH